MCVFHKDKCIVEDIDQGRLNRCPQREGDWEWIAGLNGEKTKVKGA